MNKSELIDAIASEADISKASAGRALDAAVDAVTNELKSGGQVSLSKLQIVRNRTPNRHRWSGREYQGA